MFVPLDQMFWTGCQRISKAAKIKLDAHACAISEIIGDAYHVPRLLVKTADQIFVYVGGPIYKEDDPDLVLIKLLHDPTVSMEGPVRVVALEVLRNYHPAS